MTRRLADFQSLIAKKRTQVFFVINKITAESLFLFLPVFVNITEPLSCQDNTIQNDTVLADKCGYLPRSTNTDDGPDTKLEPLLELRKKTRFLSSPLGLEKETTCCKINGRRDCSNFGVLRSESMAARRWCHRRDEALSFLLLGAFALTHLHVTRNGQQVCIWNAHVERSCSINCCIRKFDCWQKRIVSSLERGRPARPSSFCVEERHLTCNVAFNTSHQFVRFCFKLKFEWRGTSLFRNLDLLL